MKIKNDYKKKVGYDISKIPEIYDNIKFDSLHNPERYTPQRKELFEIAQMMCRAIVPFEYGLTCNDKIQVGLQIIHPLLSKVHENLLWWNQARDPIAEEDQDRQWEKTGLNEHKVGNLVKSYWRHVRTHLYFTSASHMYTLLNTLKLGVDSLLVDESDKELKQALDSILRLDFMSHFVFRLFENLSVEEDDPSRFNLEIMVNRGAVTNQNDIWNVKDHTIPINLDNYLDISKKLNLEKIDMFLKTLSHLDQNRHRKSTASTPDHPASTSDQASPLINTK